MPDTFISTYFALQRFFVSKQTERLLVLAADSFANQTSVDSGWILFVWTSPQRVR